MPRDEDHPRDRDAEPPDRAAEDRQRRGDRRYATVNPYTGETEQEFPFTRDRGDRRRHRARPRRLPGVAPTARSRSAPPSSGRAAELMDERRDEFAALITTRDGQAPRGGRRRGPAVLDDPQVLRRQRPAASSSRRRSSRDGQGRGRRRERAGRRPAGHRAVELPLLPGGPRGRPEPGAGQHGPAQARRDQPAVRPGASSSCSRRRRARGRLHQRLPAHRRRRAGHRRPARPGRHPDRQRAGRQRASPRSPAST